VRWGMRHDAGTGAQFRCHGLPLFPEGGSGSTRGDGCRVVIKRAGRALLELITAACSRLLVRMPA
jgi:hypothetical protein